MKQSKFTKTRLAIYISAALSAATYNHAFAVEAAPDEEAVVVESEVESQVKPTEVLATEEIADFKEKQAEIEVIQVTGIVGSLGKSMNLKRNASGVVDAISSEDMGKFPDTNLAESLQRITGVSVSRSNGEGSQVTIRGFGPDYNLITLNGRQMPATGNSRSYNLENISSEGISTLEVIKTARAETASGGIGGVVNIVTLKPFDSPGLKWTVMGQAMYDESNVEGDDVTPEISGVFSNTFANETFGIAASVVHHRRDFQQQNASIQGWQANVALPSNLDESMVTDPRPVDGEGERVGNYYLPRSMNYGFDDISRERTNGFVSLQYAPTDDIIATIDYSFGKAFTSSDSLGWGVWHDYGGNINAYEFDENGTATYAEFSGNDASYTASRSITEVTEKSIGLNLAWQATQTLGFAFDYHNSSNEADNGADEGLGSDGSLVLGSDQLVSKTYDYREGEIPQTLVNWNNGSTTLAPSEMDSHFSQFIHSPGKSEVEQFQLDAEWENDTDSPLVNIKMGISHADQLIGGSSAWSGLIGGFLFNPQYTAMFPDSMFTKNDTSQFLNEFDGGGNDLALNYYYDFDFDEVVARSESFLNEEVLGDDYFAPTAYRDGSTYSETSVQEVTTSAYAQMLMEFDVISLPVQMNFGLRYEKTNVTSRVKQDVPVDVWWLGGSEWHTQLETGNNAALETTGDYDVFLPMIDAKFEFTEDLIGRASWGKSLARAPLSALAGTRILSGSPKIGSRSGYDGNTGMEPYVSTNIDLSLEYYYGEASYASVGYFHKSVVDWIGTDIFQVQIDGLHDIYQSNRWNVAEADILARDEVATNDAIFAQMQTNGAVLNDQGYIEPLDTDALIEWNITQPFNSDQTFTVQGIELAIQHVFGESGFGVGINGTIMDPSEKYDPESLSVQQVLPGASDSANFQGFYEKYGWSIKTTYAWRDDYLIGIGQDQGSADAPSQNAKAYGQWDISVNYDITDNFTVFAEGINLTNETEQKYGRYERQFLEANQYGTRYVLGARYRFK
ncbi:TonB-dependent receptor [Colwellia sp. E2M01]|uniref:TonB-dependent receptor n=1 Tax=Colwellia sp. E2M01 TaxID=2841561 RepID=UPI001C099A7E|nr:TonB-dependent receptor [Colwellia sp. E2M01]MBU2869594.1 TonB-dependent receptor [Colwellia sp. E2M01]